MQTEPLDGVVIRRSIRLLRSVRKQSSQGSLTPYSLLLSRPRPLLLVSLFLTISFLATLPLLFCACFFEALYFLKKVSVSGIKRLSFLIKEIKARMSSKNNIVNRGGRSLDVLDCVTQTWRSVRARDVLNGLERDLIFFDRHDPWVVYGTRRINKRLSKKKL